MRKYIRSNVNMPIKANVPGNKNNSNFGEQAKALREFKDALQSFKRAAYTLENAWANVYLPSEIDEIAFDGYPFSLSYDEEVIDIDNWVSYMIQEVENIQQFNGEL